MRRKQEGYFMQGSRPDRRIRDVWIPLFFLFLLFSVSPASAWFDNTHLVIARTAGYDRWYNAAGADMIKLKAGDIEKFNHYYNNYNNVRVTPELVSAQVAKYNDPEDQEGHLYGAIIAALRDYQTTLA
jgi:hypothetical protein